MKEVVFRNGIFYVIDPDDPDDTLPDGEFRRVEDVRCGPDDIPGKDQQ